MIFWHSKRQWVIYLGCLIFILPIFAYAEESGFISLVGTPAGLSPDSTSIGSYVKGLYTLSISIAAILAVFKLMLAGSKYMVTDVVPVKSAAKEDIKGAIIGLFIVLFAVLILQTINKDLINFNPVFNTVSSTPHNNRIPPGDDTPSDPVADACSREGGCSKIECGSLFQNNVNIPGTLIDSTASCSERCSQIGGLSTRASVFLQCVISNADLAAALEAEKAQLENQLCLGGDDYLCQVEKCPNVPWIGSCTSWCTGSGADYFGNGTYNSELRACHKETLFANNEYSCGVTNTLTCAEATAECQSHPYFIFVESIGPNSIKCVTGGEHLDP